MNTTTETIKALRDAPSAFKSVKNAKAKKLVKAAQSAKVKAVRFKTDIDAKLDLVIEKMELVEKLDSRVIDDKARELTRAALAGVYLECQDKLLWNAEEHKDIVSDSKGRWLLHHMVNWYGNANGAISEDDIAQIFGNVILDDPELVDEMVVHDGSELAQDHIRVADKGGFNDPCYRDVPAGEVITIAA